MTRPIRKPTIKKRNIRRAEHRADANQQQQVADELHKIVDRIAGSWTFIQKQAADFGRGFKANTIGDGQSSSDDTIVESTALNERRDDPGWWAEQIDTGWHLLIADARHLDDLLRRLTPMTKEQWEEQFKGRRSTVEVCSLCNEPAAKVKRIDGLPYCATTCYYRVWRNNKAS